VNLRICSEIEYCGFNAQAAAWTKRCQKIIYDGLIIERIKKITLRRATAFPVSYFPRMVKAINRGAYDLPTAFYKFSRKIVG
jgi:hypothetical protein